MSPQQMLGKYCLLEKLGSGGFATVYKAENMNLGNEVALKLMDTRLFEDAPTVARFKQEARFSVQLDHPNIVRVMDLEEADGQLFIVMEYVAGTNLGQLLATNGLLPLDQVVAITRQIAAALDHAHSRRLVHRDIKPSNVLVRPDGAVKLTDFGIVKAVEGTKLTQTGTTIGTPAYMSPEQTIGSAVDHRSDLYSLGVVLYEMVTGRIPFDGDTPVAIGYKHVHQAPPMASTLHPRAKGPLEKLLGKALAKKPEDRFQSGVEMVQALSQAVQELEENTLAAAYHKAADLLKNRHYGDALAELEALEAMNPTYRDVSALLQKAKQGAQLGDLYEQAANHFARGRELASQITTIDPTFADPAHILSLTERKIPTVPSFTASFWLSEWFLLIGGTFIVASYSGFWEADRNQWATGIAKLLQETGSLEGLAMAAHDWVPGFIWAPLVFLLVLALLFIGQMIWPRRALVWNTLKGVITTATLALILTTLFQFFTTDSTGPYVMLTGTVLVWLATTLIPLGVYLRNGRK
ncbi:MAG: serine/threonine protein kinase [Chloroflexi bacterium]|nr:serine/threonine protein kinase [Chloroflexota bacterium]MBP8056431.1 serine/threonine protein kinase [Chloroflexota bacterium]